MCSMEKICYSFKYFRAAILGKIQTFERKLTEPPDEIIK